MKENINLTISDFSGETIFPLKHCPFCGSLAIDLKNTHTPSYWVECDTCGAKVDGEWGGDKEDMRAHKKSARSAIRKWNKRY